MKHIHCDLIIAWANGAEIQVYFELKNTWLDVKTPMWDNDEEYRIKPKPPCDIVRQIVAEISGAAAVYVVGSAVPPNLRLTFDGKTGKLKSAEVLKW